MPIIELELGAVQLQEEGYYQVLFQGQHSTEQSTTLTTSPTFDKKLFKFYSPDVGDKAEIAISILIKDLATSEMRVVAESRLLLPPASSATHHRWDASLKPLHHSSSTSRHGIVEFSYSSVESNVCNIVRSCKSDDFLLNVSVAFLATLAEPVFDVKLIVSNSAKYTVAQHSLTNSQHQFLCPLHLLHADDTLHFSFKEASPTASTFSASVQPSQYGSQWADKQFSAVYPLEMQNKEKLYVILNLLPITAAVGEEATSSGEIVSIFHSAVMREGHITSTEQDRITLTPRRRSIIQPQSAEGGWGVVPGGNKSLCFLCPPSLPTPHLDELSACVCSLVSAPPTLPPTSHDPPSPYPHSVAANPFFADESHNKSATHALQPPMLLPGGFLFTTSKSEVVEVEEAGAASSKKVGGGKKMRRRELHHIYLGGIIARGMGIGGAQGVGFSFSILSLPSSLSSSSLSFQYIGEVGETSREFFSDPPLLSCTLEGALFLPSSVHLPARYRTHSHPHHPPVSGEKESCLSCKLYLSLLALNPHFNFNLNPPADATHPPTHPPIHLHTTNDKQHAAPTALLAAEHTLQEEGEVFHAHVLDPLPEDSDIAGGLGDRQPSVVKQASDLALATSAHSLTSSVSQSSLPAAPPLKPTSDLSSVIPSTGPFSLEAFLSLIAQQDAETDQRLANLPSLLSAASSSQTEAELRSRSILTMPLQPLSYAIASPPDPPFSFSLHSHPHAQQLSDSVVFTPSLAQRIAGELQRRQSIIDRLIAEVEDRAIVVRELGAEVRRLREKGKEMDNERGVDDKKKDKRKDRKRDGPADGEIPEHVSQELEAVRRENTKLQEEVKELKAGRGQGKFSKEEEFEAHGKEKSVVGKGKGLGGKAKGGVEETALVLQNGVTAEGEVSRLRTLTHSQSLLIARLQNMLESRVRSKFSFTNSDTSASTSSMGNGMAVERYREERKELMGEVDRLRDENEALREQLEEALRMRLKSPLSSPPAPLSPSSSSSSSEEEDEEKDEDEGPEKDSTLKLKLKIDQLTAESIAKDMRIQALTQQLDWQVREGAREAGRLRARILDLEVQLALASQEREEKEVANPSPALSSTQQDTTSQHEIRKDDAVEPTVGSGKLTVGEDVEKSPRSARSGKEFGKLAEEEVVTEEVSSTREDATNENTVSAAEERKEELREESEVVYTVELFDVDTPTAQPADPEISPPDADVASSAVPPAPRSFGSLTLRFRTYAATGEQAYRKSRKRYRLMAGEVVTSGGGALSDARGGLLMSAEARGDQSRFVYYLSLGLEEVPGMQDWKVSLPDIRPAPDIPHILQWGELQLGTGVRGEEADSGEYGGAGDKGAGEDGGYYFDLPDGFEGNGLLQADLRERAPKSHEDFDLARGKLLVNL